MLYYPPRRVSGIGLMPADLRLWSIHLSTSMAAALPADAMGSDDAAAGTISWLLLIRRVNCLLSRCFFAGYGNICRSPRRVTNTRYYAAGTPSGSGDIPVSRR